MKLPAGSFGLDLEQPFYQRKDLFRQLIRGTLGLFRLLNVFLRCRAGRLLFISGHFCPFGLHSLGGCRHSVDCFVKGCLNGGFRSFDGCRDGTDGFINCFVDRALHSLDGCCDGIDRITHGSLRGVKRRSGSLPCIGWMVQCKLAGFELQKRRPGR